MKTTEFDNLNTEALSLRIDELKGEYYSKRSAIASGQEKNSASLKPLRQNIARALTTLKKLQSA